MSVSVLRNFLSRMMVVLCPLSLLAADSGAAILHNQGGVWVNGAVAMDSISVFSGDLIETKSGFVANLDAEGSSVLIQGESMVKFQSNFLTLEHGSVSVGTSTSMSVHVNCIKVEPISNDRTQYDVTDVSGTVQVAAHKQDVDITQGGRVRKTSSGSVSSQSATVREGEQARRDESAACGAGNAPNTKWLEIGGGAGAGVLVLCLLLCGGVSPPVASPWQP